MNLVEDAAIAALDETIAAHLSFPKWMTVGTKLYELLRRSGRLSFGEDISGDSLVMLDKNISVAVEPALGSWDFTLPRMDA
jgi:hypothetical protein